MTTVGVQPPPSEKILPMKMPSYSYQYPTFRRVQLAAVKEGLFHPRIPTFRRMDMDTAAHKLPDEHCRTTTACGPEDFKRSTTTLFAPPTKRLSGANITDTGRQLHRFYTTPEEITKTRGEWSDFLNKSPERYNIRLPSLPDKKDLHFVGYAVRYLKPEVTASWKYTLKQEPMLDQYGQRPMPANVFARYRDTYPQYSRNIATEAWR
ncbi:testis, prostate and placenta-expressed protein isoform X2 [Lingula anatina]|uniref:Testis, prostate and placenta-expressed protein isoform X1 n=1 Tax=Lingula anatina TaxID=7574 RepID=A0A1S3J2E6_LINAN|nr:testis, prostate and placenta-expressed protein isoform X1 [Lingula anatina]XP_013404029.1 testis, prostate and placenta-expressed protein isoform X2 [Lingula anatina]|eukprot:XP_013404028.1 testis, prostate and placenta-expressed protein isoform X1 [Lingula anatina]